MKKMKTKRARYTLEYKQEAVRLVESGETIAAAGGSMSSIRPLLFGAPYLAILWPDVGQRQARA